MENYHRDLIMKNILKKEDFDSPPALIQLEIPRPFHSKIKALIANDEIRTGNVNTIRGKALEAMIRGIYILEIEEKEEE